MLAKKNVTIRSASGYVDEANEKGATIRGLYHDAANGITNGENSVGGLYVYANAKADGCVLGGLIFEDCATPERIEDVDSKGKATYTYFPGAALCSSRAMTVTNCVFRNCRSTGDGGAIEATASGNVFRNCVITNNWAGEMESSWSCAGGGVHCKGSFYDSLIGWNHAPRYGGGISGGTIISNCVIVCNEVPVSSDQSSWQLGGGFYSSSSASLMDCIVSSNAAFHSGGGVYFYGSLVRCVVADNRITGKGNGVGVYGDYDATHAANVRLCTIVGNRSTCGGSGGGVYNAVVTDSVVSNNYIFGGSSSQEGLCGGGGLCACVVSNCQIVANKAGRHGGGALSCQLVKCLVSSNSVEGGTTYSGAGVAASGRVGLWKDHPCRVHVNIENCIISNNIATAKNAYAVGVYVDNNFRAASGSRLSGPAATNVVIVNTLIACNGCGSNTDGQTGVYVGYNEGEGVSLPTLINCTITGGIGGACAINRGKLINTIVWGNNKDDKNTIVAATNSCAAILTDAEKYPDCISTDPRLDARYAPHSRACKNKALPFDWMTDPNDVRSKDVYGAARVQGKGPDIGAVEQPDFGLMMLVR